MPPPPKINECLNEFFWDWHSSQLVGEYVGIQCHHFLSKYVWIFSPDRTLIAFTPYKARNGRTAIDIWNLKKPANPPISLSFDCSFSLQLAAFSHDNRTLAAAFVSHVDLWDIQKRKWLKRVADYINDSNFDCFGEVDFSPDGKMLMVYARPHTYLFDVKTGKRLRKFWSTCLRNYSSTFSPSGRWILMHGYYDGFYQFDVKEGKMVTETKVIPGTCFQYFPGKDVAVIAAKSEIIFYDCQTRVSSTFAKLSSWIYRICVSPSGRRIASMCIVAPYKFNVEVWDVKTKTSLGKAGPFFNGGPTVPSVQFNFVNDYALIVPFETGTGRVSLWV